MENVSFRVVKKLDDDLKELYDEAYSWDKDKYCFESYDENIEINSILETTIVMYLDNELIGYGTIFPINNGDEIIKINISCIIKPECRGMGYGTLLINYIIKHCKKIYVGQELRVIIYKDNLSSISMIENNNFDFDHFDDDKIYFSKKM